MRAVIQAFRSQSFDLLPARSAMRSIISAGTQIFTWVSMRPESQWSMGVILIWVHLSGRKQRSMTVSSLSPRPYPKRLKPCWPKIKQALGNGPYEPLPVRKKKIPQPSGGLRLLSIPTTANNRPYSHKLRFGES